MGNYKVRRRVLGTGGIRSGSNSSNYTDFNTDGYQTMAGTARVKKDIWVPAEAFYTDPLSSACIATSGSMTTASMPIVLTGSVFSSCAAGTANVPILVPHANVAGSMVYATATIPVPQDADTSGSIECRVTWTSQDAALATTGSVFVIKAVLGYLSSSATARTAASTGACGTYNYTAQYNIYETSLGNFPSFGANDVLAVLTIGSDQSEAADTGGSGIGFLGAKLRYYSNKLGTQSS